MFALRFNFTEQRRKIVFLITLLVPLFTPVKIWGFSFDVYLERAEQLKLWENPQWLKLGHYKSTWMGPKSSFTEGLFLDVQGASNPKLELFKTIEIFYRDFEAYKTKNGEHPQCAFLARAKWLNKVLNVELKDVDLCSERQKWKKELNFYSVSIIFASADLNNSASIFGHTFLKFNNPSNRVQKKLLDYGVDYAAITDANAGPLYALKGLFGYYKGQFAMLPFHQKIVQYSNIEGRDLWEMELNFSYEEIDFLVDHLLEMEKARAPYYFFSDNCSTQILRSLEVVKPDLNLADQFNFFVIPIDTLKVIERQPGLVSNLIFHPSLKTNFLNKYKKLNNSQKFFFQQLKSELDFRNSRSDFNQNEKAELLETVGASMALEEFKEGSDLSEKKHKLFLQRAVLGPGSNSSNQLIPPSPTSSHDSSAIGIGAFAGNEGGLQGSFRNAFHHLEQKSDGLIPHSHIEIASIDFKYVNSEKKLYFDRFTALELMNLIPIDELEKKISWKFKMVLFDHWLSDIEAGAGGSLPISTNDHFRFNAFLTGRKWDGRYISTQQGRFLNQNLGAGPELFLSLKLATDLSASIGATYFLMNKETNFLRLKSKLNWNFSKNWDFLIQYENDREQNYITKKQADLRTQLVYSFIQ